MLVYTVRIKRVFCESKNEFKPLSFIDGNILDLIFSILIKSNIQFKNILWVFDAKVTQ